ncbi:MAG: (2Fe-2S) ferredoxin domain-containing protein [Planctomycetota bacterium]|nr:(2Fe-2S) ferredoxin domain-containing protein [Planctomycetota bacterium]
MITITVCVGSSCHIRGARDIIRRYAEIIEREKLGGLVELKGSFCMDRCTEEGVNVRIGEEFFSMPDADCAERIFREKVAAALGDSGEGPARGEAGRAGGMAGGAGASAAEGTPEGREEAEGEDGGGKVRDVEERPGGKSGA